MYRLPLKFIRRILQPFFTTSSTMSTPVLADYIISETALIHSTDIAVASAALIIYDHIITFDQEVSVMLLVECEVFDSRHMQVDLFWTGQRDASKFFYLSVNTSHSTVQYIPDCSFADTICRIGSSIVSIKRLISMSAPHHLSVFQYTVGKVPMAQMISNFMSPQHTCMSSNLL
jgi:hypothetical protein